LNSSSSLGHLAGEVGEDDVGAGPLDGGEVLEGHGLTVDPAALGRRLQHRVLAAHVVGGHGQVDRGPDLGDDVEVRQGRLDHDHVCALVDVGQHLGHGLPPVGRVLLVALAIAPADNRHVDRVAEGPVQRRRVLGGVGEDAHRREPTRIEGAADGGNLPVHHP
jgi:hypothetical protein